METPAQLTVSVNFGETATVLQQVQYIVAISAFYKKLWFIKIKAQGNALFEFLNPAV
ncbi:MAG: hypothetical protein JXR34_04260 [Bacteroidales bacterium]|nr:hypothetical protein [Bacteroidales bacterium]